MSKSTKIIIAIFSVVVIGALCFTTYWTIANWHKVASGFTGANLYTKDDLENAYQDGYDTALINKTEYENLIADYLDEIVIINIELRDLQTRVTQLTQSNGDKTNEITALTNEINTKTARITELENLVHNLEIELQAWNESNKFVVYFLVNGLADSSQIVDPAINSYVATPPNPSGDFNFVGWSLDGTTIVNPTTVLINQHTSFSAIINCTVQFKIDGVNYGSAQTIAQGKFAVTPQSPESDEYSFTSWSIDGINPVDAATHKINVNTVFVALGKQRVWQTVHEYADAQAYTYNNDPKTFGNSDSPAIIDLATLCQIPNGTTKYKVTVVAKYVREGFNYIAFDTVEISNGVMQSTSKYDAWLGGTVTLSGTLNGTTLTINSTNTGTRAVNYFIKKVEVLSVFDGWIVQFRSTINGDMTILKTDIVDNNGYTTAPQKPENVSVPTGIARFQFWTIDGTNEINVATYPITKYTVFIARWLAPAL